MNPREEKHQFTPEQLAKQERWRHEEKFSLATTIVNALTFFPFLAIIFPAIIPIAATAMAWVNMGMTANRKQVLHDEQMALNAKKKQLLAEKDALLTQIEKFDNSSSTTIASEPTNIKTNVAIKSGGSKPTNIKADVVIKEPRMINKDNAKKRRIDTTLIKPTNVLLGALKQDHHIVPANY